MLTVPVLVSICSAAHREDAAEDEALTMITSGRLTVDNGKAVLSYEETIDESLSPQQVVLQVENECATMSRGGDYETQMVFRTGCRYEGQYRTPYGDMELAVYCTRLDYDISEEGGSLEVSYQLDLNGCFAAMHDMQVKLFVQGQNEHEA